MRSSSGRSHRQGSGRNSPPSPTWPGIRKGRRNGPGSTWRPSSRRSSVTGPTPPSRPWKPRCARSRGTPTCAIARRPPSRWPRRPSTGTTTRRGAPWPHERSPCFRRRSGTATSSFARLDDSFAFDALRGDPAFLSLLAAGHPDRRYAGVWSTEARFEAATLDGLDPAEHLRRGRELAARGYRPVAWSVSRTAPEGPPVSASVWHRPLVPAEAKDRLAQRQARAAVALVRLGKAESVWPLLRHSADPSVRSFIVNWLNPLGADPHAVAAELDRIDPHAWRGSRLRPPARGHTRRWTPCSSTPRPPSGGP